MKSTILFNSLLAIATQNPTGFTVNVNDLQPVTSGYAVAVAATQNSFGRDGLARVIKYCKKNLPAVSAVGGWLDTESGLYYFDATIICDDLETARALAIENDQIAFFDLNNMQEIRVK